ncbi:MAG TPA: 1-acyl-sn-glycerol-3-phosphate acyltransferase [Bacteroidetes bacterium]|nr:1-acyl-sn-glycerol-3-phosphate acyltransferase [Bacteroidota bacterium]
MNIFRKIWAVYGIVVFFLLWIILMPLYLLAFVFFPKRWTKYIIWFSHHIYTRLFFTLTLVRLEITGLENFDPRQTYIIVSNHRTALDFMINARAWPGVYKYLAKKELVKVPVFGLIVKKLCVLVDRRDKASRSKSMQQMRLALSEGYSIFLYPEGTRNRTDQPLLPFHKGAFIMAIESGCPIAVQTLVNVNDISDHRHTLDFAPGRVKVVWAPPVSVEGLTLQDVRKLSDEVAQIMTETLQQGKDSHNIV